MSHAILFVCTANICRSPLAEAVLRQMVQRTGRGASLDVASVGTHDYHVGRPAFPAAVEVAARHGYDISRHVARRLSPHDIDRYDMILAMDRFNVASLRKIAPTQSKSRIELLLEYGDRYHGGEVRDPYGGEMRDYERALAMIEDGCQGLVQLLVR